MRDLHLIGCDIEALAQAYEQLYNIAKDKLNPIYAEVHRKNIERLERIALELK